MKIKKKTVNYAEIDGLDKILLLVGLRNYNYSIF